MQLALDVRKREARHIDEHRACVAQKSIAPIVVWQRRTSNPLIIGVTRPGSRAGARAEYKRKLIALPSTARLAIRG